MTAASSKPRVKGALPSSTPSLSTAAIKASDLLQRAFKTHKNKKQNKKKGEKQTQDTKQSGARAGVDVGTVPHIAGSPIVTLFLHILCAIHTTQACDLHA